MGKKVEKILRMLTAKGKLALVQEVLPVRSGGSTTGRSLFCALPAGCSTPVVQYSTVQYSTVQYSSVQYSTVQIQAAQGELLGPCAGWNTRMIMIRRSEYNLRFTG